MPEEFRTVRDVAKSLVVSARTVSRMCAAGMIPAYRVGRQWRIDKEIAAVFGVSHALISRIRLGRAWRPVTEAMGYVPKPCPSAPKSGKTGVKKWT